MKRELIEYIIEAAAGKGLTIFDIDETLFHTKAKIGVLRNGKIIKQLNNRPNQDEMEKIGKTWKPYRGAAALFLWHLYNKVKVEKRTLYNV